MTGARRKRRSRPSLKTRIRTFWLVGLVVAIVAVWGGYTFVTLPAFRMKSLAIWGLERVSRSDVVARARLDPSANVWLVNRSAIAHRIEALPYVETARVAVRPVANVSIAIVERLPDACLRAARGFAVTIDREARVLERGCIAGLPLTYAVRATLRAVPGDFVHDRELGALQRDAEALAAGGDRFARLSHDAFGQLEATMPDGITVRFGADGDLERKQRLIEPILAELGARAGDVRAVDLRAPATPVVEYRH